jgi:hypothetical protein
MKRPIIITTPHPTPEETAKLLGVSKKAAKFVEALVENWALSPEIIKEFGELRNSHAFNGKGKRPAEKRVPRENGHR